MRLDFKNMRRLFRIRQVLSHTVHFSDKVPGFVDEFKLLAVFSFVPDGQPCSAQISYDAFLLQVPRLKQAKHTSVKTFAGEPAPVKPDMSYAFFAYKRRAKPPEVEVG